MVLPSPSTSLLLSQTLASSQGRTSLLSSRNLSQTGPFPSAALHGAQHHSFQHSWRRWTLLSPCTQWNFGAGVHRKSTLLWPHRPAAQAVPRPQRGLINVICCAAGHLSQCLQDRDTGRSPQCLWDQHLGLWEYSRFGRWAGWGPEPPVYWHLLVALVRILSSWDMLGVVRP